MSEKRIVEKLMIKPGKTFRMVHAPEAYHQQLGRLPEGARLITCDNEPSDIIQVFVDSRQQLEAELPRLMKELCPGGALWVTYHKGTSKIKTDINRDSINTYAASLGMQGVAMIAIDEDWAALRLKVKEE